MNAFPPPTGDPVTEPTHETSNRRNFRRFTAAGMVAGLLTGGAAGLIFGVPALTSAASGSVTLQDDSSTATDGPANTTDLAPGGGNQGPGDAPQPVDATAFIREQLQSLVDDGTITAAQADAVAAQLATSLPGPRGGHGPMGHGGFGRGVAASSVADALGMTVDELATALRDGQTLAQVAESKGVDVQVVIDAIVADIKAHLDEEVTEGDLTQADADARLADITERVTDMVNNGGGIGMGHGGHMGDDAANAATDA